MKRVIVIGPSGAGKSTFSRKLAAKTGLPLIHLDLIWHKADRTTVTRDEFDLALDELLKKDFFILDGNYGRTLERRLEASDTVFFFDLPLEDCLGGVEERIGKERPDMPWVEKEFDPDFKEWIIDLHKNKLPAMRELLKARECDKNIMTFHSRAEADAYIDSIILPSLFDTHTDLQNEFLKRIAEEGSDAALLWLSKNKTTEEFSYPRPLEIKVEGSLLISDKSDMTDAEEYAAEDGTVVLTNLKLGKDYFIRLGGSDKIHRLSTLPHLPRFIEIDGIENVRDIGGGKIKQGLLFRGSEFDNHYTITEKGKDTFINRLGIRTDLDLRLEALGRLEASPVGDEVRLIQIPYRPYREIFEDAHKKAVVRIMDVFADENNYPVYFHCWGGADRTGMIAIYLLALAGESDEVIHRDYELTSLSAIASIITGNEVKNNYRCRSTDYYKEFLSMLDEYAPSQPLSVQIPAFLKSAGVSEETMDKIRGIIKKNISQ